MFIPFWDLEAVNRAQYVEAGKSRKLICSLTVFKVDSLRVPRCGQVAIMRRGENRAGLGALGVLLQTLPVDLYCSA